MDLLAFGLFSTKKRVINKNLCVPQLHVTSRNLRNILGPSFQHRKSRTQLPRTAMQSANRS